MPMLRRFFIVLCVCCFGFSAGNSLAQVSVNVDTLDPVYRDVDKLVSHGLVKKIIMGQRPFSRREIARITAEALVQFKKLEERLADPEISEAKNKSLRK